MTKDNQRDTVGSQEIVLKRGITPAKNVRKANM